MHKLPAPHRKAQWLFAAAPLLGHLCSLTQAAQKQICITEIREHANRSLGRQVCGATIRGDPNKRNAYATTCAGVPDTIANVNSAGDSAISLGSPLRGQPDDGLSVQRIVARRCRIIIVAQAAACHLRRAESRHAPVARATRCSALSARRESNTGAPVTAANAASDETCASKPKKC